MENTIHRVRTFLKKVFCVYTVIMLVIGVCISFITGVEYSVELPIFNHEIGYGLLFLVIIVIVTTGLSLWASVEFASFKLVIFAEAKGVGLDDKLIDDIMVNVHREPLIIGASVICGSLISTWVVESSILTSLKWPQASVCYAWFMVILLAACTVYAYIDFILIVMCMRDIYNNKFKKYVFIYPIATDIFDKYNQICSFGLILFWVIGLILIFLSLIVFDQMVLMPMALIGILILAGYLVFTFYPYYMTRKKITMLKLQTISRICSIHNLQEKQGFDEYHEIVRFVMDSPTLMTSNFHLIITSTVAAIASILTSFIAVIK